MRLVRLEIRNYRSIKELVDEKAIVLDGLDCLVGKNNAGKSNILKAISYLLRDERLSEDLYYGRDNSLTIDVRGYFQVAESDFELLKIENKKEPMRKQVLDDGTIGVCRRSDKDGLEVVGLYPEEERLRKDTFQRFHAEAWDQKGNTQDFKERMQAEYPELSRFLTQGKESNKGEWTNAYERFVSERPDDVAFIKLPAPPPTGIAADLTNMLPRLVFVPAVKEVSDATRTTRTAELGGLLAELSVEVHEELDEAIDEALAEVSRRLNVVRDPETGKVLSDERHAGVSAIEGQITGYMAETFQDIAVSLEFPNPESRVMFENALVWVEEEGFPRVRVDYAGEGVKRVLIFSLVRTLADLRQGQLSIREGDDGEEEVGNARQSLLILYEEAELFLHPGLQRILLRAFESLRESGDQVVFSTHSPFMLPSPLVSTINLISKDPQTGSTVAEFHRRMADIETRQQSRLLQVQNVSAYVFADKVLLVEGESDRIVLRKLAPTLDSGWDFDQEGVPILPVVGKGDLPLFRDFLSALGIEAFVVMDLDSVEDIVPRLTQSDAVRRLRDELVKTCQGRVDAGQFAPRTNSRYVNKLVESYEWKEVFEKLQALCEALGTGGVPTEQQIGCLQRLVLKGEMDAISRALASDDLNVRSLRLSLVELLLEEGVLCLSGTIEDYYPSGGGGVEAALQFDPTVMSKDELRSFFTVLSDGETTDMEAFLDRLFGTSVT